MTMHSFEPFVMKLSKYFTTYLLSILDKTRHSSMAASCSDRLGPSSTCLITNVSSARSPRDGVPRNGLDRACAAPRSPPCASCSREEPPSCPRPRAGGLGLQRGVANTDTMFGPFDGQGKRLLGSTDTPRSDRGAQRVLRSAAGGRDARHRPARASRDGRTGNLFAKLSSRAPAVRLEVCADDVAIARQR